VADGLADLHAGRARQLLEATLGSSIVLDELKRKPGRRCTFRVRGARGSAIVKAYASDRAATVASRVGALAAGPSEPVVPRVLRVERSLRLVVFTDVEGEPLREALIRRDLRACARAGAALATWHRAWKASPPRALHAHKAARELELLQARSVAAPIGADVMVVAAAIGQEWPCTTVIHRDLYEEQIVLGSRVGLIDLDDAALGPPELDLGNLRAHVELLELRSALDLAAPFESFLAAYGSVDQELLDRCRRLALLRLACIHAEPRLLALARA
jgi:Ser/Thr protein kinase RdoA (MazF antagonist)